MFKPGFCRSVDKLGAVVVGVRHGEGGNEHGHGPESEDRAHQGDVTTDDHHATLGIAIAHSTHNTYPHISKLLIMRQTHLSLP